MHHPPTPVVTGVAAPPFPPFAFPPAPATGLNRHTTQVDHLHGGRGTFEPSQFHPAAFLHANYPHLFGGASVPGAGSNGPAARDGLFPFTNACSVQQTTSSTTCSPGGGENKMAAAEGKSFTIDAILGRKKEDSTSGGEMVSSAVSAAAGEEQEAGADPGFHTTVNGGRGVRMSPGCPQPLPGHPSAASAAAAAAVSAFMRSVTSACPTAALRFAAVAAAGGGGGLRGQQEAAGNRDDKQLPGQLGHHHHHSPHPHPHHHHGGDWKHGGGGGGGGKSKRVRTIFTPEQLERLEAEFERQQYMVGTERYYLAASLNLTEAQVKVWFQNRRIKWRKTHLEQQHAKLANLDIFQKEGGSESDLEDSDHETNHSFDQNSNINKKCDFSNEGNAEDNSNNSRTNDIDVIGQFQFEHPYFQNHIDVFKNAQKLFKEDPDVVASSNPEMHEHVITKCMQVNNGGNDIVCPEVMISHVAGNGRELGEVSAHSPVVEGTSTSDVRCA